MNWLREFEYAGQAALYGGDFPLVDVTVIPDDEIMQHGRMAVLELLQKHICQRDLRALLDLLVTLLLSVYTTQDQLVSVINYMLQAGESFDPAGLFHTLASRVPPHEETLMTIAGKLREEGHQKGREEGMQLGEQKGRHEGERQATLKIARTMLASGMDRRWS